jgi:hypothetical protein
MKDAKVANTAPAELTRAAVPAAGDPTSRPEIRVTVVDGAALRNNEVSTVIYQDFLRAARAVGAYQAAPEPRVIGPGLRHVPVALETQRSGVSATKIVVSLG